MTPAVLTRLAVERRLLAALFLWPRAVELEPRHFLSTAHGALFAALQRVGEAQWTPGGWQLLQAALESAGELSLFASAGGLMKFVNEDLELEWATEDAIAPLTERVRECPRCGH